MFENFDPNDPRTAGLLQLAASLMQGAPGQRKNFGADLGHGISQGLLGYATASGLKDRRAEEAQQRQLRDFAIKQAQRSMEDQDKLRTVLGGGQPQGGQGPYEDSPSPTAPPMQPVGQGFMGANPDFQSMLGPKGMPASISPRATNTKQSRYEQYNSLADRIEASGLPEQAVKYRELALKFQPELKETKTLVDFKTGQRTVVNFYKDGTSETVPFAPDKEKAHFADEGGSITPRDPYTGAPLGAAIPKQQSPDSKASNAVQWANFNRGQLHDFTTPGGGTGLGFVTPKGVQMVPGSGEKQPEVPASIRTKVAENDVMLDKIARGLVAANTRPESFGVKNYLGDAVRQRTDPEGVDGRAIIADIGSQKLHDRSGAAVSASESPRLMPFIPMPTDDAKTVTKKLTQFDREYRLMNQELLQGKSISQVAGARMDSQGVPSLAAIEAERMKRGR